MQFTAIDFETSDSHPESACSIGLVKMDGKGNILDSKYYLIKPPFFCRFAPRNIEIHGITPSDVRDAHDFAYLWPDIEYFIGDDILVAHNAPFDMGVLKSLLSYYRLPVPENRCLCSLQVSRRIWPKLRSHALTSLCDHFGLEHDAHNALSDAINCGLVLVKACGNFMADEIQLRKYLITRGIEAKPLNC